MNVTNENKQKVKDIFYSFHFDLALHECIGKDSDTTKAQIHQDADDRAYKEFGKSLAEIGKLYLSNRDWEEVIQEAQCCKWGMMHDLDIDD